MPGFAFLGDCEEREGGPLMKQSTLDRILAETYGPIGLDGRRKFFSRWKRHGRSDAPKKAKRKHPRGILQLWKGKRGHKRVGKKHYVAVATPKRVKAAKPASSIPTPVYRLTCSDCSGSGRTSCSYCYGAGCSYCGYSGKRTCPWCHGEGRR